MKKNMKALIGCVGALVVVGAGYGVLTLTQNRGSEDSSSSVSSESVSAPVELFSFEKSDVEYISVKNSQGEFKGVPAGEPDEDGNLTFTIEGFEDLDINTTLTSSLLNNSTALNSDSTAEENPSDLAKYGLSEPKAEITVKTASEEKTIIVGDESPISGETYCMEKGGSAVYLVATSGVSVFANSAEDFVSTTLLEELSDDSSVLVDKITIERSNLDYDIVLEYDKTSEDSENVSGTLATHYMTQPVFAYLDVEKSQDATHGLFGLSADSVITVNPGDDEIEAAGLKEPLCIVTMETDEPQTYTLKIGSELEVDGVSYYLCMYEENPIIYAISPESLCWADLEPGDITSRMIFGTYVWDVGSLEIDVNGLESVVFEGSGTDEDDYEVTKNGEECDNERFRTFYTFLLKTSAEDFVLDEQPEGEPIVTIKLETQDGKRTQTVEFYQSDGKKALISVDGSACFKCRMAYVDLLIDNLEKFDTNEEFVMNW